MKSPRQRVDQLLVARGLCESRARGQALVLAGEVFADGERVSKAGSLVKEDAILTVRAPEHGYVSRGGVKLAGALDAFHLEVARLRCLDIGASTGGFTDCLLQRGAVCVVAVDVGYGQLAHKLRVDPRVVVLERTNARTLTESIIGGAVDLTVVDASFIGLGKLLGAIAQCTRHGGQVVALVKPQFEVGRVEASRSKGVVREEHTRLAAIESVKSELRVMGFEILAHADAVLAGPKGNLEAFVHTRRP
jgi:23S rRNA (cytidine1920-2'-O)/16S rRNA (cytidine1409-2'-O)-methyltransferase